MRKSPPILFLVMILLIISLACAAPGGLPGTSMPTLDPQTAGTAMFQTMAVAQTQTARAFVPIVLTDTLTPSPTLSPTATLSPTPVLTDTPLIPLVSVSMNTNCRVGPGQVYEQVGALLVGQIVEVYARNPTNRYWYVRNPDETEGKEYCWVWGRYATVSGNLAAIPVFTPPPTPTPVPTYNVTFEGLQVCAGWWVDFQFTNTGGTAFRSLAITVRDTSNDKTLSLYTDQFTAIDDCVDTTTEEILGPAETVTVSVPAFAYDPSGHMLRATINLCTAPKQEGDCITQTFKFSP